MRIHVRRLLAAASVAALLCAGAAGAVAAPVKDKAAGSKPAFKPSKRDLAAFYKPTRVQGIDWYARIGAARFRNERIRMGGGEPRPILQMRALGPLDGST